MPGPRITPEERIRIETLWGEGKTFTYIAQKIGRDRTTIWREVKRNHRGAQKGTRNPLSRNPKNPQGFKGLYQNTYVAQLAQHWASDRARRRRRKRLVPSRAGTETNSHLRQVIRDKLMLRWSPTQISKWLKITFPQQQGMQVSHETIYQSIFIQGRGSLRADLAREVALRSARTRRRTQSRGAKAGRGSKTWTHDANISLRPAQADDRSVLGHWEGDLVIGRGGKSAIITLVERSSRFVMMGSLPDGRGSEHVVQVLTELMGRVPQQLLVSLTWDQGGEMAKCADFTLATGCPMFFADPHSPWQRGSNENTNGLIRQYYRRDKTNFLLVSQDELDEVARELNGRPHQTLGWMNPADKLNELLVATTT